MSALTDPTIAESTDPGTSLDAPLDAGRVSTAVAGDEIRIVLTGEVDLAMSAALARILLEMPRLSPGTVVDASAVTFADCALLGFLVPLSGVTRFVLKPSSSVRDLLLVAGLWPGFDLDH